MKTEESLKNVSFEKKIEKIIQKKNIKSGVLYFIALSIIGFTVLFLITNTSPVMVVFPKMRTPYIIIVFVLILLDLLLGAYRYFLLLKRIKPEVKFWLSFKANLADIFMSAVTPFQTGGGPAMLYVFSRGGIPLPVGLSVSVISFIMTLIFILFTSFFAIFFVDLEYTYDVIDHLINYAFIAFIATLLFFVFLVWKPYILGRGINKITRILVNIHHKRSERIVKFNQSITSQLAKYHTTCSHFLNKESFYLLIVFLVTALLFLNKFTLAYFLVQGLGVNVDYPDIIAIQTLILFIPYFSPTPGGSGVSELTIAGLMTVILPGNMLVAFSFLHRFFLLYIPVLFGAWIIIKELKNHAKQILL